MFGTWCSGMGLGGWIVMIGLWASFIAAAIWMVSHLFPASKPTEPADRGSGTARDILDHRLASGQIDPQTYERLLRELTLTRS